MSHVVLQPGDVSKDVQARVYVGFNTEEQATTWAARNLDAGTWSYARAKVVWPQRIQAAAPDMHEEAVRGQAGVLPVVEVPADHEPPDPSLPTSKVEEDVAEFPFPMEPQPAGRGTWADGDSG